MKLPCEVCGDDVGAAYTADARTGWVVWWRDDAGLVRNVDVTCHLTGPDCLGRLDRRRRPLSAWDGHLHWFAGRYALPQMWRILRDYPAWTKEARERLLDIFIELQKLPTGEGPPRL